MGISVVVATSARTSDGQTMNFAGMNTTGANAFALAVITNNWTLSKTITDGKGNSYLDSGAGWLVGGGSNYGVQLLYCLNPNVGTGHNLTIAFNSLCFPAAFFVALSGVKTSTAPAYAANAGGSGQTSWGVNLTPAAANSLIFAAIQNGVGGAATLPSGYTGTSYPLNTGVDPYSIGGAYAYKLQSGGPTPENPTFNWTGSSTVSAGALIFAPVPPVAPPVGRNPVIGSGVY